MERVSINFEANLFSRNKISQLIKDLSNEQLTKIPQGLNQNIIWCIGHILAMQQIVTYLNSGLTPTIKKELIEKYKTGSMASTDISSDEIRYLKENLFKTLEQIKEDYNSGIFEAYNPFKSKAGIQINSIEDGISFHTFHEGIHLGWIMEITKLVAQN